MNRREFLRLTFLGGSALVLPSGLVHAVEVLTPNNPLEYLNGNSIVAVMERETFKQISKQVKDLSFLQVRYFNPGQKYFHFLFLMVTTLTLPLQGLL